MLNKEEELRYKRQLTLQDFGTEGQEKLKKAKVLIVGLGGLGSPVALYLTAAGVGEIIACDSDTVELSNLNRQILHFTNDVSVTKSKSAANKLNDLNPELLLSTHQIKITQNNIGTYARKADLIIDCLDNIETRLVLNAYSLANYIPIVHAGINGWYGQTTIIIPYKTPCMQCLFEDYAEPEGHKPVVGAVAGILGTHQALAAIRYLVNKNTGLENKLLYFDGQNMDWHKMDIERNANCSACGIKQSI